MEGLEVDAELKELECGRYYSLFREADATGYVYITFSC